MTLFPVEDPTNAEKRLLKAVELLKYTAYVVNGTDQKIP